MSRITFAHLLRLCLLDTNHAFQDHPRWNPSRATGFIQPPNTKKNRPVLTSHRALVPLISSSFSRDKKSTEPEREVIDLEDSEDFLLAEVKPKLLIHERDFFRESTRVAAWDEYVLVSILCTSISFSAIQSFSLNPDHTGIFLYESVFKTLTQTVAGIAALSGLYSTMVFSLSVLYGKSALGLERDPYYDDFLDNTEDIRIKAFKAFSLALGCFAVLVVLVLSENLPLSMHLRLGGAAVGALYVGYSDWKKLIDNASEIFVDD